MKVKIYTDGACRGNPGPGGIGLVIKQGEKVILELGDYIGHCTNNIAEYTAFIRGLEEALKLGADEIEAVADSELLVKQIKGEYRVKNEKLKPLFFTACNLIQKFKHFEICHQLREENKHADELANRGIELKRLILDFAQ